MMTSAFFEMGAAVQFWASKPSETHQLTLFRIREVMRADRFCDKLWQKGKDPK